MLSGWSVWPSLGQADHQTVTGWVLAGQYTALVAHRLRSIRPSWRGPHDSLANPRITGLLRLSWVRLPGPNTYLLGVGSLSCLHSLFWLRPGYVPGAGSQAHMTVIFPPRRILSHGCWTSQDLMFLWLAIRYVYWAYWAILHGVRGVVWTNHSHLDHLSPRPRTGFLPLAIWLILGNILYKDYHRVCVRANVALPP